MNTPRFQLIGRVVHHTARPRFSVTFVSRADGGWDGTDIVWVDLPGTNVRAAARLMREAGDFFAANLRADWIQDAVIARAMALALSSYEIAKRTGGAVSEDHVRAYLTRNKSMGSHKLQHILSVLGLELAAAGTI